MNFGYNFGVESSQEGSNSNSNNNSAGAESQNSEYSSIDYSKIPPPTFKFGQFGQVSAESINSDNAVGNSNNFSASNGDDDSFLAEPSMSAGQFDAAFNLPTDNAVFSPTNSADSLKSSSVKSVPILVEEPIDEPVYLEEPTPHSVEELMKATVDGDTSALMPEFLEEHENNEEPVQTIQELLKNEESGVAMDSWENIDEEEIKAAEVEFFETEEFVANSDEEESEADEAPKPQPVVQPKPVVEKQSEDEESEFENGEPVEESGPVTVELDGHEFEQLNEAEADPKPVAEIKYKKKTKAPASTKAKAAPKAPSAPKTKAASVSKPKSAPKSSKKEKNTEEPVVLTEGRSKRERKTVERLSDSVMIQPTKTVTEKVPAIPAGTGMKLGDIEVINHALGRKTAADKVVIMLHKVLFNRLGEAAHRKATIRAFCGDESANYETRLKKYTNAELLELTQFLGLTSAKEKALIAARISNFLIKPSMESVKFTAKGERILKKKKKTTKPKPERSSKRINPDADKKPLGRPPKGSKKDEYLTPETVDSDVESEIEREVLGELKKE